MGAAIIIENLGKMYKLYERQSDKAFDAFGVNRLMFWRKSYYEEFWALRGLNLEISKGERLGIIGRNGAGKSTLLKLISGNITPTEGTILVNGKIQALMELGTGFHPEFTGRENIKASLAYHGLSYKKIKNIEEEIIDFTELEDFINQPIKLYSSGMYTRLAFAVATVLEPEILIIDEVLGAGDAAFTTKCSQRMRKLTEESGATVLFVSHSMESVIEICNRAIMINRGSIIHTADPITISKIYNSMIREEDEILLRAKESRLRKKDYKAIKGVSPELYPMLFRFVTDKKHPDKKHYFYNILLENKNISVGDINVGGPMDNDINSYNRIIDGKGMMDWSKSINDHQNFCRIFQDEEGMFCHAPFQMCVPAHILKEDTLSLKIVATIADGEPVHVDLWIEEKYERIGTLISNGTKSIYNLEILLSKVLPGGTSVEKYTGEFTDEDIEDKVDLGEVADLNHFSNEDLNNEEEYVYKKFVSDLSVYGTQDIVISNVDLLNGANLTKRVFFIGEALKFKINLSARKLVPHFVMVASILNIDGRPAGQVFCRSEDLGISNFDGDATVYLEYSPLRFGTGEYVVSLGLFKEYDLSVEKENASYCVVDRAIFFKVIQPSIMKKGVGAFAHKSTWRYLDREHVYDPVCHYEVIEV